MERTIRLAPTRRMNAPGWLERFASTLRHAPVLRHFRSLWARLEGPYHALLEKMHPRGVEWNLHGTDRVVFSVRVRELSADDDRAAWLRILQQVKPADTVVDVGAGVGLYTLAFARRVGALGKVFAFESDSAKHALLAKNVELNGLAGTVETLCLLPSAVDTDQRARLDQVLHSRAVDILKLDAAGLEQEVLRGASILLKDPYRRPRSLLVQLHPTRWEKLGLATTFDTIADWLSRRGYYLRNLGDEDGFSLEAAEHQGFLIAQTISSAQPSRTPKTSPRYSKSEEPPSDQMQV